MFIKLFKMNLAKAKKSYILLFLTLSFGVAALMVTLLIIRSQKMTEADRVLQSFGNYDIAFCQVSQQTEELIKKDTRFGQIGTIYDYGNISFKATGNQLTIGALENKTTERMYYINPVYGRYPEKEGEICIDRFVLKSNGFEEKTGQTIEFTYINNNNQQETVKYKLVGIIEVQKQDDGVLFSPRKYPENWLSVNNMNYIDYPFAYLYNKEAETKYTCQGKHLLTNVLESENSDNVLVSYLDNELIREELHVDLDHILGREWTAACIIGRNLDSGSIPDILKTNIENRSVSPDAYTSYFIPIFMLLIGITASLGIFDAVKMSTEEQRANYGIIMGLGMTGRRILIYTIFEFLAVFFISVIAGWIIGIFAYKGILWFINTNLMAMLPSAFDIDPYYEPYIKMVTKSPYFYSALVLFIVTCAGIYGAASDLLKMTPLGMAVSHIHKRKHKNILKSGGNFPLGRLYTVLNRYTGREAFFNHLIPYIITSIVMAAAVFGFLFFHSKSVYDTSQMTEKIQEARINGMDYYMEQTKMIYSGYNQYMHKSGITEDMLNELAENKETVTVKGVIEDYSTALLLDQDDMRAIILKQQSEYPELLSNDVHGKIALKASLKNFEYMGVDTDKQEVFHVPSTGVRDEDMEYLSGKVISGEIHPDKLQSGEEVVIAVTDSETGNYFKPGDSLPLYDFIRPEDLDESIEWAKGQLPEAYKDYKEHFTVTVDGTTKKFYCFDTMKKLPVVIGAVVYIEPDTDGSLYFDNMNGKYTVNIITGKDAFKAWGLPNRNYTKAGVTLKENADLNSFRMKWTEIMIKAGYMESVDVFSIIEEKERKQNQVMAIFYSVIGILLIICVLCTGNSIVMRICHMAEEQRTLHLLGMTKTRLLVLYIRRYIWLCVAGAITSIFPVIIYSSVADHAVQLRMEAYYNNTFPPAWTDKIALYNLMEGGLFIPVVFIVFIISVVLITLLVTAQSQQIGRIIQEKEKEE